MDKIFGGATSENRVETGREMNVGIYDADLMQEFENKLKGRIDELRSEENTALMDGNESVSKELKSKRMLCEAELRTLNLVKYNFKGEFVYD